MGTGLSKHKKEYILSWRDCRLWNRCIRQRWCPCMWFLPCNVSKWNNLHIRTGNYKRLDMRIVPLWDASRGRGNLQCANFSPVWRHQCKLWDYLWCCIICWLWHYSRYPVNDWPNIKPKQLPRSNWCHISQATWKHYNNWESSLRVWDRNWRSGNWWRKPKNHIMEHDPIRKLYKRIIQLYRTSSLPRTIPIRKDCHCRWRRPVWGGKTLVCCKRSSIYSQSFWDATVVLCPLKTCRNFWDSWPGWCILGKQRSSSLTIRDFGHIWPILKEHDTGNIWISYTIWLASQEINKAAIRIRIIISLDSKIYYTSPQWDTSSQCSRCQDNRSVNLWIPRPETWIPMASSCRWNHWRTDIRRQCSNLLLQPEGLGVLWERRQKVRCIYNILRQRSNNSWCHRCWKHYSRVKHSAQSIKQWFHLFIWYWCIWL